MKTLIFCFSLLVSVHLKAQNSGGKVVVSGRVVAQDSLKALPNTHVINKKSYLGTITNGMGYFTIAAEIGDTLVFSNVSYLFYYHLVTGNETESFTVKMTVRNYLLDEVSVDAYRLTSNDPKPMAVGKPMIPRNEDIRTPQALAPTLASPVDYLYYLFSRKPKELEKLRQLYIEDYYRNKLSEGNNREIIVQLTGLQKEDLAQFMFYCKYADGYISTLNDYEYLISLMQCYDQFLREQELNILLEEQENKKQLETITERFKEE